MCRERTIERKVMFDMAIPRVKVVNPNESWRGTECYIDGNKLRGVRRVDFRVAVDEVPQFTFETLGLPEIDMQGDVQFSFTPETVQQATVVLKHEFETNEKSRYALYDSVRSVLGESDMDRSVINMLAVKIGNRIIGLEDS